MSGIYVHIPYCKVKCHYCDFHFSTNTSSFSRMIEALCLEIHQRRNELSNYVETIYFGGGTPSLTAIEDLQQLLECIHHNFDVSPNCEVTLEANPDDLNRENLLAFYALGINRLSIGVQSFDDTVLKKMNRAHSSEEAIACIELAQDVGFGNLTADLIYGLPDQSMDYWKNQLEQMTDLGVNHISSYCLTIEQNTVFDYLHKKGELNLPSDEQSLDQFKYMIEFLAMKGFEHYEISNFAKEGFISKHNSAYWLGKKYIGVGPSAHSYSGQTRGWNVSNNARYIKALHEGLPYHETEKLTEKDKFNDYVLTRLRTKWGIHLNEIESFENELDLSSFHQELQKHLAHQHLLRNEQQIILSNEGKFIADAIAADLFL